MHVYIFYIINENGFPMNKIKSGTDKKKYIFPLYSNTNIYLRHRWP